MNKSEKTLFPFSYSPVVVCSAIAAASVLLAACGSDSTTTAGSDAEVTVGEPAVNITNPDDETAAEPKITLTDSETKAKVPSVPPVNSSDQIVKTEPTDLASSINLDQYIGLTQAEAAKESLTLRVTRIDDEAFAVTEDYNTSRVNVEIEKGNVVLAAVG